MLYVLYLLYAIAAIVAIYASLQIYIKMNTREEGITREIMMVVGACLFIIGASIVGMTGRNETIHIVFNFLR